MAIRMRIPAVLAIVALAAALVLGFRALTRRTIVTQPPRIIRIGRFDATIAWETNREVVGEIRYRAGDGIELKSRENGRSRRHEIKLGGLMPETPYTYRVDGTETSYTFKTAPLSETAFRFMIYHRDRAFSRESASAFVRAVDYHLPDFTLVAGHLAGKSDDFPAEESAFFQTVKHAARMPVFLAPAAGDLADGEAQRQYLSSLPGEGNGYDYTFDYGNSRFIVLGPAASAAVDRLAWLTEKAVNNAPKHVFIIHAGGSGAGDLAERARRLRDEGKVEALFLADRSAAAGTGAKTVAVLDGVLVVDIDGEGVTAGLYSYAGAELKTVSIREIPVSVARSCIYCRKLLDSKRYQESIQWYRDFIAKFGEKYMVDDAQYEIANIYDRYLRDYGSAIREYETLLAKYPESNKALQASQRLEYLKSYDDFGFEPLRIFEKAKSETFQRDQDKAVAEVDSILTQYPGCRLESQVLFWLGYTIAQKDLRRSSSYYQSLIRNYPASREEAWVALGDAYYLHRYYRASLDAYNTAFKLLNDQFNFALIDKIRKSQRNIVRKAVLAAVFAVLLACYAAALWIRPRFFTGGEVRLMLNLGVFYLLAGGVVWVLFFRGYPELIRYFPVLCATAATIPAAGAALSRKLFARVGKGLNHLCTAAAVFVLTGLVIYIMLYYYHYLPAFGI